MDNETRTVLKEMLGEDFDEEWIDVYGNNPHNAYVGYKSDLNTILSTIKTGDDSPGRCMVYGCGEDHISYFTQVINKLEVVVPLCQKHDVEFNKHVDEQEKIFLNGR